jgi:hypothetical protein
MLNAAGRLNMLVGGLSGLLWLLAGCGGNTDVDTDADDDTDVFVDEARWSEPPVGAPLLPDFAPVPPLDIHTKEVDGVWTVEFSSTVVNVGEGDFHATAKKEPDGSWTITQDIEYDQGGAEQVATPAEAVWAGDGHEHWHVKRYVVYHLTALDDRGRPTGDQRTDHKVGFCIYDFEKGDVDFGPEEPVYGRAGCGKEDSTRLVMGLSPGWADYYKWSLPGQSIEIDGLPDGAYRIFAVADEARVFREETVKNNRTWVDFELSTDSDGLRLALVGEVGPSPE